MKTRPQVTYHLLDGPIRYFLKRPQIDGAPRSISALAVATGYDRSHLNSIVCGRRPATWDAGQRIARALGVPTDAVLAEDAPATDAVA